MHIYPSVLQAIVGGAMRNVWRGAFMGYWGVVMQDLACELPRILIPRTSVNKGKEESGASYLGSSPLPLRTVASWDS